MKKFLLIALACVLSVSVTVEAKDKDKAKNGNKGKSAQAHSAKAKSKKTRIKTAGYVTATPSEIVIRDGRSYYNRFEVVTVSPRERYYINSRGNKIMIKVK